MKINKCICSIPTFLIFLLIVFFPPIGVYFLIIKKENDKKYLYPWYKKLIAFGVFVLVIVVLDLISEIKEIIYLYDSGMSIDMINLIPDHFWIYMWATVADISIFVGCKKIRKMLLTYQKYSKYINIDKKTSLKKLAKDVELSLDIVQKDLISLKNVGYLNFLNISNYKIIYNISDENLYEDTNLQDKIEKIQCNKCGAINKVKKFHCIECNFCGSKIIGNN